MRPPKLFYKIFIAFWLSSLCVMLASGYLIFRQIESRQFHLHHTKTIKHTAKPWIERFENQRSPIHFPAEDIQHPFKRRFEQPLHTILDIQTQGRSIFLEAPRSPFKGTPTTIVFTSASGQPYQITALKPRLPPMLKTIFKRFAHAQFLFILIASTLVSGVLSWSITRPINQLSIATRRFNLGDSSLAIASHWQHQRDEIGILAKDIAQMINKINHGLKAQHQIMHHVSHELRAPLSRLQVAAELLQQQDSTTNPFVERIHTECRRMDHLIHRILKIARMETHFKPEWIDVNDVINHAIQNIHFEYPDLVIHFLTSSDTHELWADQNLIEEALDNLLRNAIHHNHSKVSIELSLSWVQHQLHMIIRDDGIGIPQDELVDVGTPFYRGGQRMHGDGFGLGLSIVQQIMDKHQGSFSIQHHPDGGLLVTLMFNHFR